MDRYASQHFHKIGNDSNQIIQHEFPCEIDQIVMDDPYTFSILKTEYKNGSAVSVDSTETLGSHSRLANHFGFEDMQLDHEDILDSGINAKFQCSGLVISNGLHDLEITHYPTEHQSSKSDIYSSFHEEKEPNEKKLKKRRSQSFRLSSQRSRAKTHIVVLWLKSNYEIDNVASVPRSVLFTHYTYHCLAAQIETVNAATFGKIVRAVFPDLKTRRLGVRGSSKYHYFGIKVKTYLSHHWLLQASSFENLEATAQTMLTALQIQQGQPQKFVGMFGEVPPNVSISSFGEDRFIRPIFTNIREFEIPIDVERLERKMFLVGKTYKYRFGDFGYNNGNLIHDVIICTDPHHIGRSNVATMVNMSGTCEYSEEQRTRDNMSTMLHIFQEFTFPLVQSLKNGPLTLAAETVLHSLCNDGSGENPGPLPEFVTYYQHHMAELFSFFMQFDAHLIEISIKGFWDDTCKNIIKIISDQNLLARMIIIIDDIFYQTLCRALMPNMDLISKEAEEFGHQVIKYYESWICNVAEYLPETLLEAKMEHARNVCHLLKRRHSLHALAASIKTNFFTKECMMQMSKDWVSLDFARIREQIECNYPCYPELIQKLHSVFYDLFSSNAPSQFIMESVINMATSLIDQCLPPQDKIDTFICTECYQKRYFENDSKTCAATSSELQEGLLRHYIVDTNKTLPHFEFSEDIQNQRDASLQNQQIYKIQTYIEQYKAVDISSRQFLYKWSTLSMQLLKELDNSHGSVVSMNAFYLLGSFLEDYVTHLAELRILEARRPLLYLLPNISMVLYKARCRAFAELAHEYRKIGTKMSSIITNSKASVSTCCEKDNHQGHNSLHSQTMSLSVPVQTSVSNSTSNSNSGLSSNISVAPYTTSIYISSIDGTSYVPSNACENVSSIDMHSQQHSTMCYNQYQTCTTDMPLDTIYSSNSQIHSGTEVISNLYNVHLDQSIQSVHREYNLASIPIQGYSHISRENYILVTPSDDHISDDILSPLYIQNPNFIME